MKKLSEQNSFGIIQLTQSACPPIFELTTLNERKTCNETNQHVFADIISYAPEILILHAAWIHPKYPLTNNELKEKLSITLDLIKHKLTNTRIILIGPVPLWEPNTQTVIYNNWMISENKELLPPIFINEADKRDELELILKETASNHGVDYISAINEMCSNIGCISRTGETSEEIFTVDGSHLTKSASEYFLQKIQDKIFLTKNRQRNQSKTIGVEAIANGSE